MIIFDNGKFELKGTPLKNGVLSIELESGTFTPSEWTGKGNDWTVRFGNDFTLNLHTDDEILTMDCVNGSAKDFLKGICIEFPAAFQAADHREYTHSRLFLEQASGVKKVGLNTPYFMHNPPSYMLYLLSSEKEDGNYLFAALPPHQGDSIIFQAVHQTKDLRGRFGIRVFIEEDRDLDPKMPFKVSPILFRFTKEDPLKMLEELGDFYAARHELPLHPRSIGWNSWDQFRKHVTEEDMFQTQEKLNKFSGNRVKYFVIDDGWQLAYGAWIPNIKFPSGIEGFCKKITANGGIPGIWTAPLLSHDNNLPKKWLVYAPRTKQFVLDITYPGVLDYVYSIYKRLADAGIRYFKVDFTNSIYEVPRLYDMREGRSGILRKLYSTIRKAIGPESYFLGCCVPYEPAFNIVDAVRTTADIQIFWSSVQINMTSASARWWMHKKLWNNDPDFFVLRGTETSTVKFSENRPYVPGDYASGPVLNKIEAKSLGLAVYMTGGDLFPGDDFQQLNEEGKKILHDLLDLPDPGEAAVPTDLFTMPHGSIPAFWYMKKNHMLAVFNWGDDKKKFTIDPAKYGGFKEHSFFWNERPVRQLSDGSFELELEPHESAGICFC